MWGFWGFCDIWGSWPCITHGVSRFFTRVCGVFGDFVIFGGASLV